ncbi:hypothetical protein AB7W40_03185, partial [Providencia rettgeri]
HSISEKATHWVAFLRLGETNLLLMLALKPLNVPTTQLPNYPTTQLPNYPTTQLLLTTRLIYLILFLFAEPLVMNITIANGSSRCKVVSNSSLLFGLQKGMGS